MTADDPKITTEVVLDKGPAHFHVEKNATAVEHELFYNMPSHNDYAKGTVIRCTTCGVYWKNTGTAWRRLTKRAARRKLRCVNTSRGVSDLNRIPL